MEEWQAMGEGGGQQPARPPNKMLFLPANNSKSGFLQLLHENKCRGILFETEGDTLAETLATDYGNFSDVLRKSFHHEESTFFRRGEQEYRPLEEPALSVVLSSTFDQMLRLIPTIQNGLFSRFLFYELPGNRQFRNVFDQRKQVYPEYFAQLGEHFLDLYNNLESREEPIAFSLHPNQQAEFVHRFGEWKDELGEFVGADLDGVVHRLGLISFRIAMIFSTLRAFGSGTLSDSLSCEQVDFANALTLVSALRKNAINIYYRLPRPNQPKEASEYERELVGKADKIATCRLLQAQGLTYAEIAKNVLGDERKKATVWKWLNAKN